MIPEQYLQQILDHFAVGKIITHTNLGVGFEIETKQGTYYLLYDRALMARDSEKQRKERLEKYIGANTKRIVKLNAKGEKPDENAYVHSYTNYYSLYKKINN